MKLTYWDARRVAEPIRYILRYSDLSWEEERLSDEMDGHKNG